jgi:hypothetical protein
MKKQFITEATRMQKLAGINEARVTPVGIKNNWWDRANKELDLGFDDDIESYIDSYDEEWQREFAEEVMGIDTENYKDYKSQVKDIYNDVYPG